MLNGCTVNSSFDCTSGKHHIALSPEAQKEFIFVTPIGKFEFKKEPFGLIKTLAYFQELINGVLKGLPLTFGYLGDILIFTENVNEHF